MSKQPLIQSDEKFNRQSFAPYMNSAIEPEIEGPPPFNQNPEDSASSQSQAPAAVSRYKRFDRNLNKECNNMNQCSNLQEPEFCSSSCIQSLENEYLSLKKENIVQKPVNIYLKNCERYARKNLVLETINIEGYQFSSKDAQFLNQRIIRDTDLNEEEMFYTKSTKQFTEIIFHQNRQILVVKSWQKVLYQDKKEFDDVSPKMRRIKTSLNQGYQARPSFEIDDLSDISAMLELPPGFENDRCFYIKTLQFFNCSGQPMCQPILVEQIQGQFSEHAMYDVSIMQFQESIYFFRRLYTRSHLGTSLIDEDGVTQDCLQLYCFDLKFNQETPVEGFKIPESNNPRNSIFSQKIRDEMERCAPDAQSFIKGQYVLVQEYIRTTEYKKFAIVQLNQNPEEPISIITQSPPMDTFSQENDTNKQVQVVHHIQNQDHMYFLIQNMFVVVQVKYNMKSCYTEMIKIFQRNSLDVFQKIWSTTGLQIQKYQVKRNNVHNHLEVFDQYYFLDSRNKVQLLYPNYDLKINRTEITDMIYDFIQIEDFNCQEYKKINIASNNPNYQNIVQKIEDLMKILNYEQIQQSHQLTFCKDKKNQNLYMTSPKSSKIIVWWLKQHNCVECKQFENVDRENLIATRSQQMIEDQNQNSVMTIMKQVQCILGKRIISNNQRVKGIQARPSKNKSSMCGICDDDHQEEYISYRIPQSQIQDESYLKQGLLINQNGMIEIDEKERDNHVFLEEDGVKIKVKTYDRTEDMEHRTQVRLILYQPTQKYECFVFAIFNQDDRQIDEQTPNNDQKLSVKKSYFFITKTTEQMKDIIKSKAQKPIIAVFDEVFLLKSSRKLQKMEIHSIRDYQFMAVDNISYDSAKLSNTSMDDFYTDIKLTFIQVKDIRRSVNFIPFIYQDRTTENNNFLIYDILTNTMNLPICINPPNKSLKYIYEDEQGYNCFSLCRTSDVNEEESKGFKKKYEGFKRQTSKYQLFTLLSEKVGIIQGDEFLITHDTNGSMLQPIGKKQIIFSKKSQQTYDWTLLRNFKTIPFKDACSSIKGCQLIMQTSKLNYTYINLLDQDQNNLYNYKSQIVLVGQKMFQISDDIDIYAYIISTVLRKNIIIQNIFDHYEIEKILCKAIEISLSMRIPDLSYLVLNKFQDLSKQSFFQAQEILQCKSICDISLGDSESLNEGVMNYQESDESHLDGSLFEILTRGDQVRKDTLREIGFAPKILIIQKDLNFTCTIERALYHKQFKSAKIILNHVHMVINTFEYQHLIMNDLPVILDSNEITINEFFQISESERKGREREGFCNIEITIKDPEVPVFSDKSQEYIVANEFKDYIQYEQELVKKIILRDKQKMPTSDKKFVITHTYVDFRDVILGEKVRQISKTQNYTKIKFDNQYYADWMQKCGEQNLEFYLQESVQKLIDYQWTTTRVVMGNLFMMYVLLFLIPLIIMLFTENETVHATMLKIASPPAIILFTIELIQMSQQGLGYFIGWNLIDFLLFAVFSLFQYKFFLGEDHSLTYMPEIKMTLIFLAFMKMLFFVRIFEKFGFLVQMILLCVLDLIPFIISYMIFFMVFTICFVTLRMEVDPEVDLVENLSYFQKMLLQTFRTAIGEVAMPMYGKIMAKEGSIFNSIHIILIWICWFVQIIFMFIIMLNFLIAVISSTYVRVLNYQKIISYVHKAELNVETFQLISFFMSLEEYRFIVFSTSKQAGTLEDDQFSEIIDLLKKFIFLENKELKQSHDVLTKNISEVSNQQDYLTNRIQSKFDALALKQNSIREDLISRIKNKQN